jgi:hypothetical protein
MPSANGYIKIQFTLHQLLPPVYTYHPDRHSLNTIRQEFLLPLIMVSGAAKKKKKRANAAAASASSSSPSVPTSSLLEAVHARLARELHEKHDIVLVHTEEKGRCCLASPQGFEPGRVLIEEEAYM